MHPNTGVFVFVFVGIYLTNLDGSQDGEHGDPGDLVLKEPLLWLQSYAHALACFLLLLIMIMTIIIITIAIMMKIT